ncbi:MAG: hypothetical protein ACKO96_11155 [Flammeovirgaceae bacterium]
MSVKQILEEIESLPTSEKEQVYSYILEKADRKKYAQKILGRIKGSGKGIWNMDAQEYVNQLRADDRI